MSVAGICSDADGFARWKNHQPRLLVVWGKFDPSFDISEPEAYRSDVATAKVHVLAAGHFALDTHANEIADLVAGFPRR